MKLALALALALLAGCASTGPDYVLSHVEYAADPPGDYTLVAQVRGGAITRIDTLPGQWAVTWWRCR